jgi:hypothetical protein
MITNNSEIKTVVGLRVAAVLQMPTGLLPQTVALQRLRLLSKVPLQIVAQMKMDRMGQMAKTMEEPPLGLKLVLEVQTLLRLPKIEAETFQPQKQLSQRLRTQIQMPIGPLVTMLSANPWVKVLSVK